MSTTQENVKANAAPMPPAKDLKAKKEPKGEKVAKEPKEKKEGAGRKSALTAMYPLDAKITILAKENPKRAGSVAHLRFGLYRDGMTVKDYLEAKFTHEGEELKGTYTDLAYNASRGFIKVG